MKQPLHRAARPRRWLWLAVVAALVAACAADPDDSTPTSTAAATPAATTAARSVASTEAPVPVAEVAAAPALVLGFLGPGAGLLDELAIAQERALALAVEDINAAGGVLGGSAASVVVQEAPAGDMSEAIDALVQEGADVLLGPVGSDSALAALPVLRDRGLVACSGSATLSTLTAGNTGDAFFRAALADDLLVSYAADEVALAADLVEPAPPTPVRMTVMARGDDYGLAVGNGLAMELSAQGFEAVVEHYHPRTVVFRDEVADVIATTPDLVVVAAYEEAPRLLDTLVDAGFPADHIVGLDGLFVPRLAAQTFPAAPERLDGMTILATTGDRAFTDRLLRQPGQQQIVYAAQLYDCAVLMALAAAAAGTVDPVAVGAEVRAVTRGTRPCSSYRDCAALIASGDSIRYVGASGPLALDDLGDVTAARFALASFEGGQLVERRSDDVDFSERRRQAAFAAAVLTTQIQQGLRALGYYDGEINGVFDEATREALRALQRDLGIEETGEYDEATDLALRERLGAASSSLTAAVEEIQDLLTRLGYYDGPIDGRFSTETADAITALQRDLGVPETGLIDIATLRAAYARGVAVADEPPAEPPIVEPDPDPIDVPVAPAEPPTTPASAPPPPTQPVPTPPVPTQPAPTQPAPTQPAPTQPAPTAPVPTDPPATDPPVTDPPATDPPVTDPPVTDPPVTDPPVTDPPGEEVVAATLYEVLSSDGRFTTLVGLLRAAGFDEDLSELGPLTLFAPVNSAFAELPVDALRELESDPDALAATLAFHLVPERVTADDLVPGALPTAHGAPLVVEAGPSIGGARIVGADEVASNGILHAIDRVLTPP